MPRRRVVEVEDTTCICGVCRRRFDTVKAFDEHRRRRGGCVRPAPRRRHVQPALPLPIPKPRPKPRRD